MRTATAASLFIYIALAACAGRDPNPVQIAQPADAALSCEAISAQIADGDKRLAELATEKGDKVAQNVVAGVAGLFFAPIWLATDFKDAAGTESTALEQRRAYLAQLYQQKGCNT